MKIAYLSPGAGNSYCGNCLRDNVLAAELHRQGHDVCTVPLYLPAMLDEPEETQNVPIFFGGINVYFAQKLPFFRYAPKFIRSMFDSRSMLKLAGSRAASTQPAKCGDLTISMLQGQDGRQRYELDELCRFLKTEVKPDVVCFSNALLLGMQAAIKAETGAKTVCQLSGEDSFLDNMTEPFREQAWKLISKHCTEVDVLTAPSNFYAGFMAQRLKIPPERIKILPPGIRLPEEPAAHSNNFRGNSELNEHDDRNPVLGFFSRITPSKGPDTLFDAFIELRKRGSFPRLELHIGGGKTAKDIEPFLDEKVIKLKSAGWDWNADDYYRPNLNLKDKWDFLRALTLFSVPSRLNEPFGLFVLEAFAAGVPSLYPNRGAFPEIAEQSEACVLFEPENPAALADAVEKLLADEPRRREMSVNARNAVAERWNITKTAHQLVNSF